MPGKYFVPILHGRSVSWLLYLSVLLLPHLLYSQIKIKEKVELKKENAISSLLKVNGQLYCSSSGLSAPTYFFLDEDFNYVSTGYRRMNYDIVCADNSPNFSYLTIPNVRIRILSGAEFIKFKVSTHSKNEIDRDFWCKPPWTYCSNLFQDAGTDFICDTTHYYAIVFEGRPVQRELVQVELYWHNLSENGELNEFYVVPARYHFLHPDTLQAMEYGQEHYIKDVSLLNQCESWTPCPSASTSMTAEVIRGKQYGRLLDMNTYESDTVLTDIHLLDGSLYDIYFVADRQEPVKKDTVIIHIGSADPSIIPFDYGIVISPSMIVASSEDSRVARGDTAFIAVKQKNGSQVIPFPEDEYLDEVEIVEGSEFGVLIDQDGYSSDRLGWVAPDFRFAAFDNVKDSSVVRIKVSKYIAPPETGEINASIRISENNSKSKTKDQLKNLAKAKDLRVPDSGSNARAQLDSKKDGRLQKDKPLQKIKGVIKNPTVNLVGGGDESANFVTILIRKPLLKVTADTIYKDITTRIYVQAIDKDSNNIKMSDYTPLMFSLDSMNNSGRFINIKGDTTGSSVQNVIYADARAGKIRFYNLIRDSLIIPEIPEATDPEAAGANYNYKLNNQRTSNIATGYSGKENNIKVTGNSIPVDPLIPLWALVKVCGQKKADIYGSINVTGPEITILSPFKGKEEWITSEPKMPEVICKAQLTKYRGNATFDWEYWICYKLYRHEYKRLDTLCSRTGKVAFTGTSLINYSNTTEWRVSFRNGDTKYIRHTAAQPRRKIGKDKHGNNIYIGDCNELRTTWNEGPDIFIGGYVFVQVTAKDENGRIIAFNQADGGTLLGSNPTQDQILSGASAIEFQALLSCESEKIQFNKKDNTRNYAPQDNNGKVLVRYTLGGWKYNKKGYPVYGPPNGFGLGQIDNSETPTEMQIWNWKSNLDESGNRIILLINKAEEYINQYTSSQEDEDYYKYVLTCAYQRYNSNQDWYSWDKFKGWQKQKGIKNDFYGPKLYQKYLELKNR